MQLWTIDRTTDPPKWKKEPFNPFGEKDPPGPFPDANNSLYSLIHEEACRTTEEIRWIIFSDEEQAELDRISRPLHSGQLTYVPARILLDDLLIRMASLRVPNWVETMFIPEEAPGLRLFLGVNCLLAIKIGRE